jgi:hypothetical protein
MPEPLNGAFGILSISLWFGGIPYAVLAAWATWRVGTIDERSIRRLAIQAPFLMLLPFLPYALMIGSSGDDVLHGGLAFFAIGAIYILPIGYCYVAIVLLLAHFAARYLCPISPSTVTLSSNVAR